MIIVFKDMLAPAVSYTLMGPNVSMNGLETLLH